MEKLIEILSGYDYFPTEEIQRIISSSEILLLSAGKYLAQPHSFSEDIIFIRNGVLRSFSINTEGKEIVHYFMDEQNFIINSEKANFVSARQEYIQALKPTELIILKKQNFTNTKKDIALWEKIYTHLTIDVLSDKIKRIGPMLTVNATERYRILLESFPQLTLKIPLYHIAAYLGVTRQSLSRIRKNIACC